MRSPAAGAVRLHDSTELSPADLPGTGRLHADVATELTPGDPEAEQPPLTMDDLPQMPVADHQLQRAQSVSGVTFVLLAVLACVGVTCGVGLRLETIPYAAWWACLFLIVFEAVLALICLARLMLGDPGRLERSRARCFPMPEEVAERLRKGEDLDGLDNIRDGNRSYCVRCCVWRDDPDEKRGGGGSEPHPAPCASVRYPHHCRTCGRCVEGFDHHCGVFGRCIAQHNLPYFYTLVALGYAGFLTTIGVTLASVALDYS